MTIPQVNGYGNFINPYLAYLNPQMNNWNNYGYYNPAFMGVQNEPQPISVPQPVITPQVQSNAVNFKASEQIQTTPKKEGLSTGTKIVLATLGTIGIVLGADFLLCKGKHTKKLLKNFKSNSNDIKTKPDNNKIKAKTDDPSKKTQNMIKRLETSEEINKIKTVTPIDTKKYSSLDEAITDYNVKARSSDYDAGKDYDKLINQLEKHKYSNEKSYIEVTSRGKEVDYEGHLIDIENNKMYNGLRITARQNEFKRVDMPGSYLIRTLSDGRRVVGISVPTGRCDGGNRSIRAMINIVSKEGEFTPMQKDLIEIISSRCKKFPPGERSGSIQGNPTDILSLGVIAKNDSNDWRAFEINEEILLSSIYTAKKQLKNIDNDFVRRALKGETLEHITTG